MIRDARSVLLASTAALAIFSACASSTHRPSSIATKVDSGHATDAGASATEAGPSHLELLAQKHDHVAAGMREVTRADLDLAREHDVALAAFDADTCVRAVFDADAKVSVVLVDERDATLSAAEGTQGAIGAAGPVCFRKGDVATFRFSGQARARIVVWSSP